MADLYGQVDPTGMSLEEAIRQSIEERVFQVRTALPAKVLSYDEATQSAQVQPVLRRGLLIDGALKEETMAPISNVPVMMPSGNGYVINFSLAPGDIVLLLCSDRSLDRWLDADPGDILSPRDTRRHDLSDAIAIPGLRQRRHAPQNQAGADLYVGSEDGNTRIRISKDGEVELEAAKIKLGTNATQPAVLGTALATYLNTTMRIPSPLGPLGPAIPALVPGQELSSKVEVE